MTEPLDDDYLMELASEQQRRGVTPVFVSIGKCPHCQPHDFHGLRCTVHDGACGCPTSFEASA